MMKQEWKVTISRRDDDERRVGKWQAEGANLGEVVGELLRAAMQNMADDACSPVAMLLTINNELLTGVNDAWDGALAILQQAMIRYENESETFDSKADMIEAMKKAAGEK